MHKFKLFILIILTLLTSFCFQSFLLTEESENSQKPWLGVSLGIEKKFVLPNLNFEGCAIKISNVVPNSPASKCGLLPGDIIFGINNSYFHETPKSLYAFFTSEIKKFKPNDTISLNVYRPHGIINTKLNDDPVNLPPELDKPIRDYLLDKKEGTTLTITVSKPQGIIDLQATLSKRPENSSLKESSVKDEFIFPNILSKKNKIDALTEKLVKKYEITEDYNDLLSRLAKTEQYDDFTRLNIEKFMHRNPTKIQDVSEIISNKLLFSSALDWQITEILSYSSALLNNRQASPSESLETTTLIGKSPEESLDKIMKIIAESGKLKNEAFENLTQDEMKYISLHLPTILEHFTEHIYLNEFDDWNETSRVIKISEKINYEKLFKSAIMLSQLSSPEYLKQLEIQLQKFTLNESYNTSVKGVSGKVHYFKTNESNLSLIVTGKGENRFNSHFDITIDLGGNDFYTSAEYSSINLNNPCSLSIDFGGNDVYSCTTGYGQGCGIGTNSMLIDIKGNDTYTSISTAQGCGILGCGILFDIEGNDIYKSGEYAQGVALWGIGLLVDSYGNDKYEGALYTQGVGMPKGLGLLYDNLGNDSYYATGKYQSSYGTKGIFKGNSQGHGVGFRGIQSGGIGLLFDGNGRDLFTAGNFSQGCGYYYGIGLFIDEGDGNDVCIGSRYGQAAAAHEAIGIFINNKGNDVYKGFMGALQSASWDETCTLFVDKEGDDFYDGSGFFSQCASAHNGYAMFIDMNGNDVYKYKPGLAIVSGNHYHGGFSFSLFIDEKGINDAYLTNDFKYGNNKIFMTPDYGFFIDNE